MGIIDEAQENINELYRGLGKSLPYYRQSEPSVEKCVILEKEAEILWDKVRAYEKYSDVERSLRYEAVEALKRHERQLLGRTKRASDVPEEQIAASSWEMKVRVKMIRAQIPLLSRNADEDDQRLAEIERKGAMIEEQYQKLKKIVKYIKRMLKDSPSTPPKVTIKRLGRYIETR